MGRLTEYFFKSLPDYFYLYDSYKSLDPGALGRGLLERYMLAFEEDAEVAEPLPVTPTHRRRDGQQHQQRSCLAPEFDQEKA